MNKKCSPSPSTTSEQWLCAHLYDGFSRHHVSKEVDIVRDISESWRVVISIQHRYFHGNWTALLDAIWC